MPEGQSIKAYHHEEHEGNLMIVPMLRRSSLYTSVFRSRHTGMDAGPVRARSESSAMDGNLELTRA